MLKKLMIKTFVFCFIDISFWLTTEILDFCRTDMDIKRALEVEGRLFLNGEPPPPPTPPLKGFESFESFKQFLEFSIKKKILPMHQIYGCIFFLE